MPAVAAIVAVPEFAAASGGTLSIVVSGKSGTRGEGDGEVSGKSVTAKFTLTSGTAPTTALKITVTAPKGAVGSGSATGWTAAAGTFTASTQMGANSSRPCVFKWTDKSAAAKTWTFTVKNGTTVLTTFTIKI